MAHLGHHVVGLDVDTARIAALSRAEAPFHEPGFAETLREQVRSGRLSFSTEYSALPDVDVHFLALGTPQREDGLSADLSYIDDALDALAPHLRARAGRP